MSLNVLVVIVVLNVLATIALWRGAARKEPFLKKKFINALWYSQPIEPKHRQPEIIGEGWKDQDRKFFADFADFAEVMNWWFADAEIDENDWRLQELPDIKLKHEGFGRRYEVYHNQVRVGELEVSPSNEEEKIITRIDIEWVRLLPISTIRTLLRGLALHVCDFASDPASDEALEARLAIEGCLTDALWATTRHYGSINLVLHGSPKKGWYFWRRDKWKEQRR
jgi:hypothetical protein